MRKRVLGVVCAIALLATACGGEDDTSATTATPAAAATPSTIETSTTSAPRATTSATTQGVTVTDPTEHAECAHVIGATITEEGDGTFQVAATVASNETGWDKYADRWEVRGPGGTVLGERVLLHPHENEQPFTRSLNDVEIPADVAEVTIAAHDSVVGFCGDEFRIAVPGR